jgi:beta-lactam-binding protein with PASTA domain
MPNLVGQALGMASRAVQDEGFKLGIVSVAMSPVTPPSDESNQAAPTQPPASVQPAPAEPTPASIIVSQAPAAGQKVLAGATVSVEVR